PHGAGRARGSGFAPANHGADGRPGTRALLEAATGAVACLPIAAAGYAVPGSHCAARARRCGGRVPETGLRDGTYRHAQRAWHRRALLRVSMDTFRAFHYQVAIVEAPVPMFSGRMTRETDVYYRLEVFTQTGSGDTT